MKLKTFLLPFFISICFSSFSEEFSADKGIIDLASWQVEEQPIVLLEGEWEFYWNELLNPKEDQFSSNPEYYSGDKPWNTYEQEGKTVGGFGYATYRLQLINLPDSPLNLVVTNVLSCCKVYCNGEFLTEVGKVGTTKETSSPHYENRIVPLPEGEEKIELVVQISNFYHRKGGFAHPFQLAKEEASYTLQREQIMLDGVISSCYLFAGVFFLTLWIFRKKDKTLLYMSLFCLAIVPRALTSNHYMINTVVPDINWTLLIHIEYLSMFLPFGFILLFIRERFPKQAPKKLLNVLTLFMFAEAAFTVVTPPSLFSWLVIPHQFISILCFVIILWVIIKALKAKVNGAFFGGTAILCLTSWAVLILLQYLGMTPKLPYLMTGLQIGFLLSMSLLLGASFSSQFSKVEALQETTQYQKNHLEIQNLIVKEKNEEILSSISYAKRIQGAILPPLSRLKSLKADSFIVYLPKDIVAGDFYWIEEKGDLLFFAVADCTGHGVPGAMVSVVCNSALNRSIREFELEDPAAILDQSRKLVLETFESSQDEMKDGMDIALCVLNLKTNELKFAGANNSLYVISPNPLAIEADREFEEQGEKLYEFKGDKQPIGVHPKARPFKSRTIQLPSNTRLYMSSDGFPDQFGGEQAKKFMYKPFKRLLLENHNKSFEEQASTLIQSFENWKGQMEQTDDICVLGVKV